MSAALLIQGLQARVSSLEARERRSDIASRVDAFEREMINLNNALDVLRMSSTVQAQTNLSQLDNVVVASLRGAVDGICKREAGHAARLQSLEASMQDLTAIVQKLHDQPGDLGSQVIALREVSKAATAAHALAQSELEREIVGLRGSMDSVTRTALEHAREGRAELDALRSEVEHLKSTKDGGQG